MKNEQKDIHHIYQLDGKVPLAKAIPFGLQHVLAMFVANIAPIIIAGACGLDAAKTAGLIQTAMMIAGIGSVIQLYSVWKIGARLPIVMGISFTFVSVFCFIGPTHGACRIFSNVWGVAGNFAGCSAWWLYTDDVW